MSDYAEHTRGEWRTGREDMQSYDGATGQPFSSVYVDDKRAGKHLGEDLPLRVATIHGEHLTREEEKANARLIAAAPDLLTALREIREACCSGEGNLPAADIERAQAAIEKAEGR